VFEGWLDQIEKVEFVIEGADPLEDSD
jgi:hypothetical protein